MMEYSLETIEEIKQLLEVLLDVEHPLERESVYDEIIELLDSSGTYIP